MDYTGKRYFTYTNDLVSGSGDNGGSVPSYTIFNASLGYRLKDMGFGNAGDAQTFLAGAPMQWFVSLQGQF